MLTQWAASCAMTGSLRPSFASYSKRELSPLGSPPDIACVVPVLSSSLGNPRGRHCPNHFCQEGDRSRAARIQTGSHPVQSAVQVICKRLRGKDMYLSRALLMAVAVPLLLSSCATVALTRGTSGSSTTNPSTPDVPPGQCRIWFPDRPPELQPAPGDCEELAKRVPPGAKLIYGRGVKP
jgi:hypothetical protein